MINIADQIAAVELKGTLQFQPRVLVFNSSYSSPLINFQDQILIFVMLSLSLWCIMPITWNRTWWPFWLITPMLFWVTITIPFLLRGARPIFVRLKTL